MLLLIDKVDSTHNKQLLALMKPDPMAAPLLTAQNASGQVHLIIGTNSLSNARCTTSLKVGAIPKVIAPAETPVHYGLTKRIEDGEVIWVQKTFEDADLRKLGRPEVDWVIDAVFVTQGENSALSM